jgi:hypothetical protein
MRLFNPDRGGGFCLLVFLALWMGGAIALLLWLGGLVR